MTVPTHITPATDGHLATRAAAHCTQKTTRPTQKFQAGVTCLETTAVMYALEAGIPFRHRARWWTTNLMAVGMTGPRLHQIVTELIRTGLVRHWIDPRTGEHTLIPARVHLAVDGQSACRFVGEDMGPMRARLATDVDVVDCRDCLAVA